VEGLRAEVAAAAATSTKAVAAAVADAEQAGLQQAQRLGRLEHSVAGLQGSSGGLVGRVARLELALLGAGDAAVHTAAFKATTAMDAAPQCTTPEPDPHSAFPIGREADGAVGHRGVASGPLSVQVAALAERVAALGRAVDLASKQGAAYGERLVRVEAKADAAAAAAAAAEAQGQLRVVAAAAAPKPVTAQQLVTALEDMREDVVALHCKRADDMGAQLDELEAQARVVLTLVALNVFRQTVKSLVSVGCIVGTW
jgi:hypothetical protein